MNLRALALTIVLAVPAAAQDDPARQLIERLTDDSIEERQKAARALADLGQKVVPLLQELTTAPDPELQSRARAILRAIAQNEILRKFYRPGPRVSFDLSGATVPEALEALAKQTGETHKLPAEGFGQDRVTLAVKDVTAWDALARLCESAPALTYSFDEEAISFARKRRPAYPSVRQGEFQVWLDAIQFTRDYEFTGTARENVVLGLNIGWERGLTPASVDARITDVLDEKGDPIPQANRGWFYPKVDAPKGRSKREEFRYMLPPGAAAPRRISRVKGSVVFSFPLAYEDAAIALDSSAPMTRVSNFTVAIRSIRNGPGTCAFDLVVTYPMTSGEGFPDRLPSQNLLVIDDTGAEHKVSSTRRGTSYGGQSFTIQEAVTVALPAGRVAAKVKIRVLKEILEKKVPFDFSDLPGE
jgi:hypothetical protein